MIKKNIQRKLKYQPGGEPGDGISSNWRSTAKPCEVTGKPANRWTSSGNISSRRLRNSSTESCHRETYT